MKNFPRYGSQTNNIVLPMVFEHNKTNLMIYLKHVKVPRSSFMFMSYIGILTFSMTFGSLSFSFMFMHFLKSYYEIDGSRKQKNVVIIVY